MTAREVRAYPDPARPLPVRSKRWHALVLGIAGGGAIGFAIGWRLGR